MHARVSAVLCLALTACASAPKLPPEATLSGAWRNADGITLSLEQTGLMVIDLPGPRPRSIVGDWSLADGVATIRYRPESKVCVDEIGQYRLELEPSGESFSSSMVRESCDRRRTLFEGVWKRADAGRAVPPGAAR